MEYINTNIPTDELTSDLNKRLQEVRHDDMLYSTYVHQQQDRLMAEKKARAEGKAEGRAEGKAEGRAEGKAEGRAEGISKAIIMLKNIGAAIDTIVSSLMSQYSLSKEEATQKVNEVLASGV